MKPSAWRYRLDRVVHGVRRQYMARQVEDLYASITAQWDKTAFQEHMRAYWDPFPESREAKFLNVEVWMREAIYRYFQIDAEAGGTAKRILDLGSGTGYFMLVAKHHGHDVVGLDLPGNPLYDACFDFFDLPRILHRIEPQAPLPQPDSPYDLITAFMPCFDVYENDRPWRPDDWHYFLQDLRGLLTARGRVAIKFNLNAQTGEVYSDDVARLMRNCDGFRARLTYDYALLQKI